MFKPSPNQLVMYEGGGYDGCFYEWNYAFFDENSKFHCIAATGINGCKTEEQLLKRLEQTRHDIYDFNNPEEIARFGKEAPISHLMGTADWFHTNYPNIVLTCVCEECKETVPVTKIVSDGMHGCGGIVYEYDQILCIDCFCEKDWK